MTSQVTQVGSGWAHADYRVSDRPAPPGESPLQSPWCSFPVRCDPLSNTVAVVPPAPRYSHVSLGVLGCGYCLRCKFQASVVFDCYLLPLFAEVFCACIMPGPWSSSPPCVPCCPYFTPGSHRSLPPGPPVTPDCTPSGHTILPSPAKPEHPWPHSPSPLRGSALPAGCLLQWVETGLASRGLPPGPPPTLCFPNFAAPGWRDSQSWPGWFISLPDSHSSAVPSLRLWVQQDCTRKDQGTHTQEVFRPCDPGAWERSGGETARGKRMGRKPLKWLLNTHTHTHVHRVNTSVDTDLSFIPHYTF